MGSRAGYSDGASEPLVRATLEIPKPLARWYLHEARLRELSRDVVVAWVLNEAARQVSENRAAFDVNRKLETRADPALKRRDTTRISLGIPRSALFWLETHAAASDVSRNHLAALVLLDGQKALLARKPAASGFLPSERRLRELARDSE